MSRSGMFGYLNRHFGGGTVQKSVKQRPAVPDGTGSALSPSGGFYQFHGCASTGGGGISDRPLLQRTWQNRSMHHSQACFRTGVKREPASFSGHLEVGPWLRWRRGVEKS
ncbi:hypothetical protein FQA47_014972 [Oryzias melastigma]|uniref:Uncharacterized protein n=1 Tax=Oryzias melastigma TaxID=30732 RepID=A0A834C3J6_ORYME|nr:hypothetical protein FQA47_014972 [Oryzias melastigma]